VVEARFVFVFVFVLLGRTFVIVIWLSPTALSSSSLWNTVLLIHSLCIIPVISYKISLSFCFCPPVQKDLK
jgi:hypothetical protein